MTADEIYQNLTSRGMELKKGVATVLRLQSAWKLTQNPKRWLENFRHQCHKKAKTQQVQAFKDIAKEMVLEDFDAWLEAKLAEDPVREARHELAIKLMGEHAPTVARRKLQARRGMAQAARDALNDEEQGWEEEEMSNTDHENEAVEESTSFTGGVFAPMEAHADDDMLGNDGSSETAANVAMRVFDSHDQTMPPPAAATNTVPSNPAYSTGVGASASPSQSVATPGPKRGAGRPSMTKQPSAKSGSKSAPFSTQEAPTAQMSPAGSGALPGVESQGEYKYAASAPLSVPALVLHPEEAEANRTTLSTLDQYKAAAEAYQQILQARTDNTPLPGSLTGLPPSSKEVEAAKRNLKEVTQAMMLNLD